MCSGVAPPSAEHGHDVLERLPHLRHEASAKLPCASQPDHAADEDHSPRALMPLA